jgi:hypothetical protein
MTYGELLETLQLLTHEQLNMNVTVYVRGLDEYYPARSVNIANGSDILDNNHPFIKL